MTSLSSVANGTNLMADALGPYERNLRNYGPVVATVVGAADALGQAASATTSFSSDALSQLASALEEGVDAVVDTAADAADVLGDFGEDALDTLSDVGSAAVSGLGDVACYLMLATQAVGSVFDGEP